MKFKTLIIALCCLPLLSCEHDRYWRGGQRLEPDFVKAMADPDKARAELDRTMAPPAPKAQSEEEILAKSIGCISCHSETDESDMHIGRDLAIGCTDCHGGNAQVTSTMSAPGKDLSNPEYIKRMMQAHVQPRNPKAWYGDPMDHLDHGPYFGSRNPENTYALLNQESPEFVRFINPGDLRVASYACGACHPKEVSKVGHSMMAHGAQLWGAALYNNGGIPNKIPAYGESYSAFGLPQRLQGVIEFKGRKKTVRWPNEDEVKNKGVITHVDPLPVWNIAQPGNILRIFERGTKLPVPGGPIFNPNPIEIGNPNPLVEGGRPDKGLSPRGLGTINRTDPVFLGLQKTRLLDPILPMLGTNDHPGDFRSSGCTACHTPYANDRDPFHSGADAKYGHMGTTATVDPTIPKNEPGHPIKHVFTTAISNAQCIVCHIHPGTSYANTYLGYMWWDNESDGEHMYPNSSHNPTDKQMWAALRKNPEGSQLKGLWGNLYPDAVSHTGETAGEQFLEKTGSPEFNDKLSHNQFADFHGHGWMFRAVHKKDRQGNLLTLDDQKIDFNDPEKWKKAVHLRDVHLEKGMHCVDCHFELDAHGDGKLYGEVRNAIEITCVDCHGDYFKRATLRTSGPAAPPGGTRMDRMTIGPKRVKRFRVDKKTGEVFQRSSLDPTVEWKVTQTIDTINPDSAWAKENPKAAELSRRAKTMRRDGKTWGDLPKDGKHSRLAHGMNNLECYTCHTSWMTSCFGCHLPMEANHRAPALHNENMYSRNYTRYNYQVLRDEVFMLGRDSTVKGGRIVPVRSSSAVIVSSQNQNREWVYHQQQTISAEGYSGQAFNPHFPHATSGKGTTKMCSDCHISKDNDNNAWMAQVLTLGTNFVNFLGRYVYVATGKNGFEAVPVSEHDEPQAIYGSHLHELAYPDEHQKFVDGGRDLALSKLQQAMFHHGAGWGNAILDLQLRGEYVYAARGKGGLYVYDVANIDNKGFSERMVSAPVSPVGQSLGVDTQFAVAIESPTTLGVDPVRTRLSSDPSKPRAVGLDEPEPWHVNQEQAIHPMYAYLYIGDRYEGLVLSLAATLLDGDPANNFLERAVLEDGSTAFNPDGLLDGVTDLTLAGHYMYVTCARGLVILNMDNPLDPQVVAEVGTDVLRDPRCVQIQFRYAFVTDADGLKIIDISSIRKPKPVAGAVVPLSDAQRVYVARSYAFVAAGSQGLAIIDVTNPEKPSLMQLFTDDGHINDAHDVKVGMTNASLYAYVADGHNGLKVLELMGPHTTPQFRGFAPPLAPKVIASYHTHGPALAISKGLDRDRAVDESGNQLAVFGRLGSRPLNRREMMKMYLKGGEVWTVSDEADTQPKDFTFEAKAAEPKKPAASTTRKRPGKRKRPGRGK